MDDGKHGGQAELEPRPPEREDLVRLCRSLNDGGCRYLIVGGFAIIQTGYPRLTGDVDILIDSESANEQRVYRALECLPDGAVRELEAGDVSKYVVVRIADEIIVDLMSSAAGIDYQSAASDIVCREVDGVCIPFASPRLLWRMKAHTHRAKDAPDLEFLRHYFAARGEEPPE
ncbi:nucleotidyltransferase [Kiritimatiella glycovorans]|uniref:Nucleotidyltransferase family protein n=1 Tax=Kiritimatiella glycovorans TaxID=1307763 RepID=A0A0G3EGQ2_9BACT|nr:nucleotidyltransferase [Kiritimatiella glycovorans]AKJ63299.1 hypothetical protein L21SP4_00009 [Kiritimatiella glycovorans]